MILYLIFYLLCILLQLFSFRDICEDNYLNTESCRFFNKDLVYVFFGRPAYRIQDAADTSLEFNWPIIFIFDPNKIDGLSAVYPFDTGAFYSELYKGFFSNRSRVEDYELPGVVESA